ncbi:hypothetical protein RJT34_33013 [Clitoria ternatea]|uniref:RING-type E3 ubiquitin transferase n=1 Tax=Clitoria ternatea TaxID=43366 RepID=A0AAN9EZJ6_CLITE
MLTPSPRSVAVAVSGGAKGSQRAVQWAVDNLVPQADRFILVHVFPTITTITTPSGEHIPISEADADVFAAYVQDVKQKSEQIFVPFKKLCDSNMMETILLEDDNPASALLSFISESGVQILVLGSEPSNFITRKLKGPGIPTTILRCAPESCDVYVVARDRIISKLAGLSSSHSCETSQRHFMSAEVNRSDNGAGIGREMSGVNSSSAEPKLLKHFRFLSISERSYIGLQTSSRRNSFEHSIKNEENPENCGDDFETISLYSFDSIASAQREQLVMQEEVEQLQLELQNTIAMYKQVCEDLVQAQNKALLLSSESLEEVKRVNASLIREEALRKIAAEEKAKYIKVTKQLEEAKNILAKESYERQMAELNVLKESIEKQRIVDTLLSNDKRYRKYSMDEIKIATNSFAEDLIIGEGGYGKVYKCILDHTPVAVKVLHPNAMNKKDEFLKEVEILSQLHHPNMVLLLGACPEKGCLVYEYLENGSLEDYLLNKNGKPLPWFSRFRIVFEMACGLSYLHNSKPEPIVHRDIKPGNILLDRNCVSKISDVGLAKLLLDIVPDNVTEYRESILAGTLHYMDPEYQRTGTVRPKSDVYAFGVITLQLITGRHARGLILSVEDAISNGSFRDLLDKSAGDWPLDETMEFAQIALKCAALRCRDRPELDTEVLPLLKKLSDMANVNVRMGRNSARAPSQYYCPILQEIMDDPHIAADGFTYEYRAITAWLNKHNVSPMTKLTLRHSMLIPNHTLRSAIQEWKSGV